jgi:glutaconate CoA-transferase, subunit A
MSDATVSTPTAATATAATGNDKTMTEEDVVERLADGMTLGIGGWGSRRKPMSVVRAILRSDLRDLTVVSFGGPDVGMLCAAGKVRTVVFAFVSLDVIALEPYFRRAREQGEITVRELDEGMMVLGLQAAAWRVPFLPTRAGLGSDLFRLDPGLRTVTSPYPGPSGRPEELVAVPALELDAAVVHVNRADRQGNGQLLGVDPYFDHLFLGAARDRYLSCDALVETEELITGDDFRTLAISRHLVDAVVSAPGGAHPTSCEPSHPWDVGFLRDYAGSAGRDGGWEDFRSRRLPAGPESVYQQKVAAS